MGRERAGGAASVERNVGGRWAWRSAGRAPLRLRGRDLAVLVPRSLVGRSRAIGFKWADGLPEAPAVADLYREGDVAPDARFEYRYALPRGA